MGGGGGGGGEMVYGMYRAMSRGVSPWVFLYLKYWRRLQGLEHSIRWPERFGRPSSPRPPGPLLHFHAVSLGEGMAALPVINHCLRQQCGLNILMTTTTISAFEVIKDQLPSGVIYQFAPVDTPSSVDAFLSYWNPKAIFLIESELWPNLIISASQRGISLALLNARMSAKSFTLWSGPVARPLISLVLSKFSLIAPLSTTEAIRFQLLQASPNIIHFAGDLKYAKGCTDVPDGENHNIKELQLQIVNRPVWMAASLHNGEEEVMLGVHRELMQLYPNIITIIVPRHPDQGQGIAQCLQAKGFNVALRSRCENVHTQTHVYIMDTLGELRSLYQLTPIAVVGGSFLSGLSGHNISEAAAAGCAVLTGPHVGHFSNMVMEMQRINPLSVLQVSRTELRESLEELFVNNRLLTARRLAAKQAFLAMSSTVVENVWNLVNVHVLKEV